MCVTRAYKSTLSVGTMNRFTVCIKTSYELSIHPMGYCIPLLVSLWCLYYCKVSKYLQETAKCIHQCVDIYPFEITGTYDAVVITAFLISECVNRYCTRHVILDVTPYDHVRQLQVQFYNRNTIFLHYRDDAGRTRILFLLESPHLVRYQFFNVMQVEMEPKLASSQLESKFYMHYVQNAANNRYVLITYRKIIFVWNGENIWGARYA